MKLRFAAYWLVTSALASELLLGAEWDLVRRASVVKEIAHLGYPPYLLPILGGWKILGAAVLLAPRLPRLKEWAYAGAFF